MIYDATVESFHALDAALAQRAEGSPREQARLTAPGSP
jgi:hypothetical protein